jgi:hypothetical protein
VRNAPKLNIRKLRAGVGCWLSFANQHHRQLKKINRQKKKKTGKGGGEGKLQNRSGRRVVALKLLPPSIELAGSMRQLPSEMWALIFSHLPLRSLADSSRLSHAVYELLEAAVWRRRYFEHFPALVPVRMWSDFFAVHRTHACLRDYPELALEVAHRASSWSGDETPELSDRVPQRAGLSARDWRTEYILGNSGFFFLDFSFYFLSLRCSAPTHPFLLLLLSPLGGLRVCARVGSNPTECCRCNRVRWDGHVGCWHIQPSPPQEKKKPTPPSPSRVQNVCVCWVLFFFLLTRASSAASGRWLEGSYHIYPLPVGSATCSHVCKHEVNV